MKTSIEYLQSANGDNKEEKEKEEKAEKKRLLESWVDNIGSERLKLAKKLGLLDQSMGVYYDERIAIDVGDGWSRWDGRFHEKPVLNPSLEALVALDDAHGNENLEEAELTFVTEQMDDYYSPPRKFVALSAKFLGKWIYREV